MIIKNAAFMSEYLTNKLSISITFETILKGRTAIAILVLVQSWTVTIKKSEL